MTLQLTTFVCSNLYHTQMVSCEIEVDCSRESMLVPHLNFLSRRGRGGSRTWQTEGRQSGQAVWVAEGCGRGVSILCTFCV